MNIAIAILSAFSFLLLALLIRQRGKRIEEAILKTPPTFIEVLENKPMKIKVDEKYTLTIRHPSSIESIKYLSRMRALFTALKKLNELKYSNEVEKSIQTVYVSIALMLYEISKNEYNFIQRIGYRSAILIRAIKSTEWMTAVVSEINDFWKLLKKKEKFQADGITLRQVYGETYTWDLLKRAFRFTN